MRRAAWPVGFALLVLSVTLAAAARSALVAAQELESARGILAPLASGDPADASFEDVRHARALIDRAERRLAGVPVDVASYVPVLGRNVLAERAVARASASVVDATLVVLDAAPTLRTPGGVDVSRLRTLAARLEPSVAGARRDVAGLRAVRTEWTPDQVQKSVIAAEASLSQAVDALATSERGLSLAVGLLGGRGPRELLVALGNNAELRGIGGYVSTYATGSVVDGRLALDPFRDVVDMADVATQARRVQAPAEFSADYGAFLADTTFWREWTMSPDVPDAALVASNAAGLLLAARPDLVVILDVPALASLVELGGQAVQLPDGTTVAPGDLTAALLADTYAQAGTDREDQDRRRAALRAAAGETASRLLEADVAPGALVQELGRLSRGRHLALWSARPEEQRRLEAFGLAGSADPEGDDLLLVSANNINANKLDYYVSRDVSVEATVHPDRVDVVQRVVLRNDAPADLVPYVAGVAEPGTVRERVEFSLAPGAGFLSLRQDGAPTTGGVQQGGERDRVHTFVELPRGDSVELELRYALPVEGGRYALRLVPQALARDASLDVVVRAAPGHAFAADGDRTLVDGAVRRAGSWSEVERISVVLAHRDKS